MAKYLTDELELQSVANAIRAKGNTSESLAFPNGFVSAIEEIETGSGSSSTSANAVNFRDYDGTIVQSYSAVDFAALTALPANPSHDGLTAQGWNWTLAKAQAYVAKYGRLEIGQMYITDDGKTRVYIHLEKGRTSPMLGVCPNGTVDVDWGDGTAHDTLTGSSTTTVKWTPNHAYASPGDYVIKLTVSRGMGFYGENSSNRYAALLRNSSGNDSRNYVYRNAIRKVEIGSGVTSIGNRGFNYCYGLSSITIPSGVTRIENYVFQYCYNLASITLPDTLAYYNTCTFQNCYNLLSVILPNSAQNVEEYGFDSCYTLESVTIPDKPTSIGRSAFNTCWNLSNITIPDGITSIGIDAFKNCYSVAEYHLAPTTPPTLASTSAFSGIPADCVIYVPYSEDHSILEAYKTATNWSTYASHIQEEPV